MQKTCSSYQIRPEIWHRRRRNDAYPEKTVRYEGYERMQFTREGFRFCSSWSGDLPARHQGGRDTSRRKGEEWKRWWDEEVNVLMHCIYDKITDKPSKEWNSRQLDRSNLTVDHDLLPPHSASPAAVARHTESTFSSSSPSTTRNLPTLTQRTR